MRVKNKPETKETKALLQSVELNLRPLDHPVLGRREVTKGRRAHGFTDEELLYKSHAVLCDMLGYSSMHQPYLAPAAFAAEIINQMPEDFRRLAASLIITGDAMELGMSVDGLSGETVKSINRVRKYTPLTETRAEADEKGRQLLWTPNQGRP